MPYLAHPSRLSWYSCPLFLKAINLPQPPDTVIHSHLLSLADYGSIGHGGRSEAHRGHAERSACETLQTSPILTQCKFRREKGLVFVARSPAPSSRRRSAAPLAVEWIGRRRGLEERSKINYDLHNHGSVGVVLEIWSSPKSNVTKMWLKINV